MLWTIHSQGVSRWQPRLIQFLSNERSHTHAWAHQLLLLPVPGSTAWQLAATRHAPAEAPCHLTPSNSTSTSTLKLWYALLRHQHGGPWPPVTSQPRHSGTTAVQPQGAIHPPGHHSRSLVSKPGMGNDEENASTRLLMSASLVLPSIPLTQSLSSFPWLSCTSFVTCGGTQRTKLATKIVSNPGNLEADDSSTRVAPYTGTKTTECHNTCTNRNVTAIVSTESQQANWLVIAPGMNVQQLPHSEGQPTGTALPVAIADPKQHTQNSQPPLTPWHTI